MTKEELKAKELFDIYNRVGLQQRDEAKECALMCVDKILGVLKELATHYGNYIHRLTYVDYIEVKQILINKY